MRIFIKDIIIKNSKILFFLVEERLEVLDLEDLLNI